MKKFRIIQSERHAVSYIVEAEDVDDALRLFKEGYSSVLADEIVGLDVVSVEAE